MKKPILIFFSIILIFTACKRNCSFSRFVPPEPDEFIFAITREGKDIIDLQTINKLNFYYLENGYKKHITDFQAATAADSTTCNYKNAYSSAYRRIIQAYYQGAKDFYIEVAKDDVDTITIELEKKYYSDECYKDEYHYEYKSVKYNNKEATKCNVFVFLKE